MAQRYRKVIERSPSFLVGFQGGLTRDRLSWSVLGVDRGLNEAVSRADYQIKSLYQEV
jgi:hypothetical protein